MDCIQRIGVFAGDDSMNLSCTGICAGLLIRQWG